MDILKKIAREELKFWTGIEKIITRRYHRVPTLGKPSGVKMFTKSIKNYFTVIPIGSDDDHVQYNPITRDWDTVKDKLYHVLRIELKNLLSSGVVTYAEFRRINKLAKMGGSSFDLAKVIVNNYRNKRLRKQRSKKNVRKA